MVYQAQTIKCSISGVMAGGEPWATTFATLGPGGNPQTSTGAAVTSIKGWLQGAGAAGFLACLYNQSKVTGISALAYTGGAVAAASESIGVNILGSGAAGQNPAQLALVASLRTDLNTRSGRGRMFVPADGLAFASGQATQGVCNALAQSIVALAASFTGGGDGLPQTFSVASLKTATTRPVTRIIVDSRLDVIRHRAQGEDPLFTATVNP